MMDPVLLTIALVIKGADTATSKLALSASNISSLSYILSPPLSFVLSFVLSSILSPLHFLFSLIFSFPVFYSLSITLLYLISFSLFHSLSLSFSLLFVPSLLLLFPSPLRLFALSSFVSQTCISLLLPNIDLLYLLTLITHSPPIQPSTPPSTLSRTDLI